MIPIPRLTGRDDYRCGISINPFDRLFEPENWKEWELGWMDIREIEERKYMTENNLQRLV